eukprot:5340470-Pyramimonas_sp.AAC.1
MVMVVMARVIFDAIDDVDSVEYNGVDDGADGVDVDADDDCGDDGGEYVDEDGTDVDDGASVPHVDDQIDCDDDSGENAIADAGREFYGGPLATMVMVVMMMVKTRMLILVA